MRERRKREIKNRKNFLPGVLLSLSFWALLVIVILFTDPDIFISVITFFIVLFLALFFSLSLALANTRRGIIATIGIIIFLILRYLGVGNLLNGILIAGATLAAEIYFWYSGDHK